MNETTIEKAILQFGKGEFQFEKLGNGLIHRSYKVKYASGETIVLQCINSTAFKQPENIVFNYHLLYNFLKEKAGNIQVPRPVTTVSGKNFWVDAESNTWRATQFAPNSYAPTIADNLENVYAAAKAFALFTKALDQFDTTALNVIIPRFHDLAFRYKQFEDAITKAPIKLLLKATHVISELRDRKKLVDFYNTVTTSPDYPDRVMHHDAKISNVLFDKTTDAVRGPIDLDTIMPGKFFSDAGDMIRTMACSEEENSTAWEKIDVKPTFYEAIVNGYVEGMADNLTEAEKKNIHAAGLIMIYMQCLRFVTDFLNNDIYYQTTYPEQNLNRALNQLILLEKLEEFLEGKEFRI